MKTDDLIAALSADTTPQTPPAGRLARTLPFALVLPFLAVVLFWQVRPDLAQALTSYAVYKTLVPSVLSLAALWLAMQLTRPEARARTQAAVLGAVLIALAATLAYGLATSSRADIAMQMDKPEYINCLISVPFLSLLPLAAMVWAMRAGAPRHPVLAGALAGLVAGGIGAAAYSLHCPHDALMYFFAGYGVAIAMVSAAGAVIGWKALRW
jgi:hypothetical protein